MLSHHRRLLHVSKQLEAEFEGTYCAGAGEDASAAAINPARLTARLVALESMVPVAAEEVLALARTELAAAESSRAAAADLAAQANALGAVTSREGGDRAGAGPCDVAAGGIDAELAELCARLEDFSAANCRENSRIFSTESKKDHFMDIDKALLSAGLAGADGEGENRDCSNERGGGEDAGEGGTSRGATPQGRREGTVSGGAFRSGGLRKKLPPVSREQRKRNGKENVDARKKLSGKKPNARARASSTEPVAGEDLQYCSIPKTEYQRLPRMLKQQAKLEELNVAYAKAFELLSAHTAPMPEEELLAAIGEESNKRIDVLRRGFSLLKQSRDGWTLGKTAPTQTVGRSRPPPGSVH